MGYTTDFTGSIAIEPPLNPHEIAYLKAFAESRRMNRRKGPYYIGGGYAGQDHESDIIDYNSQPVEQPGLWCKWEPTEDGTAIEWDGAEKFYDSEAWMAYLIDTFLRPGAALQAELANPSEGREYPADLRHFTFDHVLNGTIEAQGEQSDDVWRLVVVDNEVSRQEGHVAYGDEPSKDADTVTIARESFDYAKELARKVIDGGVVLGPENTAAVGAMLSILAGYELHAGRDSRVIAAMGRLPEALRKHIDF